MTVEEIKDEIRTLSRSEKIEIYRWLDDGVVAEFSSRIGADRSLAIRQEIEQKVEGDHPEKRMRDFRSSCMTSPVD